ncbi:MAG TPA: response regulator, partial [Casimicrobiaceae bacterium]|nr:response regulator [Casimicrobiaceae bacterium]
IPNETYASAPELLDGADLTRTAVLLLDVQMPAMNGLELQEALNRRNIKLPVVFLSGTAGVPTAVSAMRAGAYDFIEKPFDNADLVARVRCALAQGIAAQQRDAEVKEIMERIETLTPREREVLDVIVTGKTSKEAARVLGTSHRTVEIHRAHVVQKMRADSLADLVRMHMTVSARFA